MSTPLPPLETVRAGLRRATELLAAELARPGGATPGRSASGPVAPNIGTPGLEAPDLDSPGLDSPDLVADDLAALDLDARHLDTPDLHAPNLGASDLDGADRNAPDRNAPDASSPDLNASDPNQPDWNALEWRLAMAAAAAHGVSPLLERRCGWTQPAWRSFLAGQRGHVEQRHRRIDALLRRIDEAARADGLPLVALKGSALHALGVYAPGERPMADIDLLVHPDRAGPAARLLERLGYRASFAQWKHLTFTPSDGMAREGLGEHRDTPVNIELHTRIHERLPVDAVDITEHVYPRQPRPGINPYPSSGALMAHLLLHAAGNLCGRSLRLLHLHDIALLCARMAPDDWHALRDERGRFAWWAWPTLRLVAHYYRDAVPGDALAQARNACPLPLRAASRRHRLSDVSCSHLWLQALPGIEWSRSPREAARYLWRRARPTQESKRERADMARTQFWLRDQPWVTASHGRRLLAQLLHPVPRMDTLYVVRQALAQDATG